MTKYPASTKNGLRKRTYYGVPIGILTLDTKFQRFNGDIGNAQTWPFPVQYKIVHARYRTKSSIRSITLICFSALPTRQMN